MTLHNVKSEEVVAEALGGFGVAQSTIDLIKRTMDEKIALQSRGYMRLGLKEDGLTSFEISAEEVKKEIEDLKNLLNWVESNCEVLTCKAALNMNRESKKKLEDVLGRSFIDTVLIASEEGNLLYSDDRALRSFANIEFGVKGIWTQILLMYCLNNRIIEKEDYNNGVVKLASSNYYHTSINGDILMEAAKQAGLRPVYPYESVILMLSGNHSDELSALHVSIDFLYQLYIKDIPTQKRDYLIIKLLGALMSRRNKRLILGKLSYLVKLKFAIMPLAKDDLIRLFKAWRQTQII